MTPPSTNDPLSRTLAAWRVEPAVDPNFRPAVWQRIRHRAGETWSQYVQAHLARWSFVSILAVSAAGWLGHTMGEAKMAEQREAMVTSYLVELDPRVQAALRSP